MSGSRTDVPSISTAKLWILMRGQVADPSAQTVAQYCPRLTVVSVGAMENRVTLMDVLSVTSVQSLPLPIWTALSCSRKPKLSLSACLSSSADASREKP